jgi:hypothetical protein
MLLISRRSTSLARFYVECSSRLLDKNRGYEYRSTSLDATVNIYQHLVFQS